MKTKDIKGYVLAKIKSLASIISALAVICGAATGCAAFVANKLSAEINSKLEPIADKVSAIEMDTTRIQLITLIRDDPDNTESILKIARHYFVDLSGDWYATAIFQDWCAEKGVHIDWAMPI
jgi:hypothetical protein